MQHPAEPQGMPVPLPPGMAPTDAPPDAPEVERRFGGRFLDLFRAQVPDTEFMRERSAALLQGPPRATHWILWSVIAFFACALLWAALAEIDQIVVGQGRVIPSSRVQVVQNLEGGIVSVIRVKAGDMVKKDQVVMELDATRFSSQLREGEAKDQFLQARIARLNAEAEGKPFVPPADLSAKNPRIVAEEHALFEARQRELNTSLQVLREQATQRAQELEEMRSRERQLVSSEALVARELALTRPLAAQGAVSQVEVLRLERAANELHGDLEASRLAIPRLESALKEVRQKFGGYAAQHRAEASKELGETRAEQAMASAGNVELEDRVTRTLVRAPMAGIVKQVKISTVGGVVQPGMDLIEIVPIDETLLIEARVRPSDIAFLQIGQPATVKLSAYDYTIYGGFDGVLEQISADTVIPETPADREENPYYLIRVRTTSNRLKSLDRPVNILPGMEATADIRTDQRTVLQYLLKPLMKTKDRALREH
ncbi:MAG: HlyD family type I secretion periplasmic adaptor subunit [Panacagrimonas sp.]